MNKMRKGKSFFAYKRGNVFLEVILILVFIFAFAVVSIFSIKFYNDIEPELQQAPDLSNDSKVVLADIKEYLPDLMNNAFLLLLLFLWLATIFLSFTIDTNPAFFIISLVLLIIALFISMMVGNVYIEMVDTSDLSSVNSDFNIAYWVFTHIPLVTLVIGATLLISVYAKNKFLGGGI